MWLQYGKKNAPFFSSCSAVVLPQLTAVDCGAEFKWWISGFGVLKGCYLT